MKLEKESKTNPGDLLRVPFQFDDAMKRAILVKQPKSGATNKDYQKSNEAREKRSQKE